MTALDPFADVTVYQTDHDGEARFTTIADVGIADMIAMRDALNDAIVTLGDAFSTRYAGYAGATHKEG